MVAEYAAYQGVFNKLFIRWNLGQNSPTTIVIETEDVGGTTSTEGEFGIHIFYNKSFHWKYIGDWLGVSKLCIRFNLDQTLSTVVDAEYDNEEDTSSTDGTCCICIL